MPVHIDEIVADVEPEPGSGGAPDAGGGAGGGEEKPWFCASLQREHLAQERRERMRVD